MATATEAIQWVSLARGQREAAFSRRTLLDYIAKGKLSVRRLPGARPRVRLDEVRRIIEQNTRPATAE